MTATIGVMALQGGFREHGAHLRECGIDPIYVTRPEQIDDCAGLILPGGESTCMRRLMKAFGLDEAVQTAVKTRHLKVWGTCAGAILSAAEVVGEEPCLSIIDASIERNIFGSQLASFAEDSVIPEISSDAQHIVYIRAPGIVRIWGETKALLSTHNIITAAENSDVMITSFHPELSAALAFHAYFIRKCGLLPHIERQGEWAPTSWMTLG